MGGFVGRAPKWNKARAVAEAVRSGSGESINRTLCRSFRVVFGREGGSLFTGGRRGVADDSTVCLSPNLSEFDPNVICEINVVQFK